MSQEIPSGSEARVASLEARVEALEQALAAEQERAANMRHLVALYKQGLDQAMSSYEKAFDHAARSYEPIIERALLTTGRRLVVTEPTKAPATAGQSETDAESEPGRLAFLQNVVALVDDLPRVLAGIALLISLVTGGTSVISLFQSVTARTQAVEARIEAQSAKETSASAVIEASVANDTANEARTQASEARVEAENAKQNADTAIKTVLGEGLAP